MAPFELEAEEAPEGQGDVETEGFERRPHFVGMTARKLIEPGTGFVAAIETTPDIGEGAAAGLALELKQPALDFQPLGAYKILNIS